MKNTFTDVLSNESANGKARPSEKTGVATQKTALAEAVEAYLSKREQKVRSNQLSERTLKTDRRSLNLFLDWIRTTRGPGPIPVDTIDRLDLKSFKEYRLRRVSPTTTAKNLRHLKAFFSDLVRRETMEVNPVMQITIPKSARRLIVPTEAEFRALKNWLDKQINGTEEPEWIHLLMKLSCYTGMRLGEMVQIKWQRGPEDHGTGHSRGYVYLDSEEKTLTIKFKRKLRVIPVDHIWDVFEHLRKIRRPGNAYVFASPQGGHYDESYVCRRWKKEVQKVPRLSKPYTSHDIRHAVVTRLLRSNHSTHKVGKFVGHSSEQITEMYGHLVPSDLAGMAGDLTD